MVLKPADSSKHVSTDIYPRNPTSLVQELTNEQLTAHFNGNFSTEEMAELVTRINQFLAKYPNKSDRPNKDWVYEEITNIMIREDVLWAQAKPGHKSTIFLRFRSFIEKIDAEIEAAERKHHRKILQQRDELKKLEAKMEERKADSKRKHGEIILEDGKLAQAK